MMKHLTRIGCALVALSSLAFVCTTIIVGRARGNGINADEITGRHLSSTEVRRYEGLPASSASGDTKLASLEDKVTLLTSRLDSVTSALERLWCLSQSVMSNGGFCVTGQQIFTGGNNYFDLEMCYFMEELIGNSSLVDLGAGLGNYGMCFLRVQQSPFKAHQAQVRLHTSAILDSMGSTINTKQVVYSWHGYDGAFGIDDLSGGFIQNVDLSKEGLWLGRRWDWVMSVEVGEHIDAASEDFFIDNLVRHACKGVLLTWAIIGQPGHKHINNRNNDYIKRKMAERGLRDDIDAEQLLRNRLTNPILVNTVMIFRKQKEEDCLTH